MWLFLAVAEIRKVCKWSKIRIFSNFWAHPVQTACPTWMALCQNVRRSVSYIRDRTWRRHFASLRKIEMVAVLCTNGPPPCHFPTFCPQGVADPQKGRRHVPTQATPACKIWRESARGLLRNRWPNKQTNIQISQGGGSKSRDLQSEISVRIESRIESADSRLQLQWRRRSGKQKR